MKIIFLIGLAYFLVYWCYYSAYNYMLIIISYETNLTPKQYSFLDMLQIVEFIGGFMWTNLADRTSKHKSIIIAGLLGYALFLSAFRFAPNFCKVDGLNFYAFLYKGMCSFFSSAIFATLDAFCLQKLSQNKKSDKLFGRIRIFACVGQFFAHIFLYLFDYFKKVESKNGMNSIIITNILAVICSFYIFLFLKNNKIRDKQKHNDSYSAKYKKNIEYIKKLAQPSFILLLTTIFLQGIHRRTVSSYLDLYYENNNINKSKRYLVFAMRSIPETILFFYTKQIQSFIGIYWMQFASIFFGVIRPISYSLIDLGNLGVTQQETCMYLLELTNGIFGALYYYSSVQIANGISSEKTKYLAQGLIYGSYNGLAPCFAGLLGYLLLETEIIKYKNDDIRGLFLVTGLLGCLGFVVFSFCMFQQKNKCKI